MSRISIKKKVLRIGVLILIIAVIAKPTYSMLKTISVRSVVRKSREVALLTADTKLSAQQKVLRELGIDVSEPLGIAKTSVCYVNHTDSGWFASDWYQRCYIRYLHGYITDVPKQQVYSVLENADNSVHLFGNPYGLSTLDESCVLYAYEHHLDSVVYRSSNVLKNQTKYDDSCSIPSQIQGNWSVGGPIILDNELSVKRYQTFDDALVKNDAPQIWLVFDVQYYQESLGCGFGLFCSNPRSTAVQ